MPYTVLRQGLENVCALPPTSFEEAEGKKSSSVSSTGGFVFPLQTFNWFLKELRRA